MTEQRFTNEGRVLVRELAAWDGQPVTLMEVCGSHTVAIARSGLKSVLPATIRLVSGPGCPVCVTPVRYIDHALALGQIPGLAILTFGDLLSVPGSMVENTPPPSLLSARSNGADVKVVYSARHALQLARDNRKREVVFLGVGFETTAPGIAATILQAAEEDIDNFSVLSACKTIPAALLALAAAPDLRLDGFICPGHVSVILGPAAYQAIADQQRLSCAIAGFEPVEILRAVRALLSQISAGQPEVINCYPGAVRPDGNPRARETLYRVFEPCDSAWRGLGLIRQSGLAIRPEFRKFDAAQRFAVTLAEPIDPKGCRCGDVLRGAIDPRDCPLFAKTCTPDNPLGACMVSSEGSCAASYTYGNGA